MTGIRLTRNSVCVIALLLLAISALAQDTPTSDETTRPRVTITVTVDGLSCSTTAGTGTFPSLTWSFGGTEASSSTASGAAKVNLGTLNITKRADACSPALFGALVTGKTFKTVTVVQQNSNKENVFSVTLNDALISSYQLGGDVNHEFPVEQISFKFAKITFSDSQSGAKFAWDTATNSIF